MIVEPVQPLQFRLTPGEDGLIVIAPTLGIAWHGHLRRRPAAASLARRSRRLFPATARITAR